VAAPDVVVVGAGAIGAACAWELAGAGLRVTVVDRGRPGGEASGASAGLLSAWGSTRAGPIGGLSRLSRDMYGPLADALREEVGLDIGHERGGHLDLCMSEAEVRDARAALADPRLDGERLEFVSGDDLPRLEPAVTRATHGALLLPRNAWVDNGRLVTALVRAGTRRGVRFLLGDPVEELCRGRHGVTGVRARQAGRVEAGVVVLAAGAWGSTITGVPPELRLRPVKGQMIALATLPPVIHHVILHDEMYLVPRANGECLVGATVEDGPADQAVTAGGLAWLTGEALATVPALADAPFLRAWAGLRPATPDGLPVVGPWPGVAGLMVAAGHYRNGILLTPVTARIVREWVIDGQPTLPADVFLPERLIG
jgi:glycine oxidase